MSGWGKAGVRLTDAESAACRRQRSAARFEAGRHLQRRLDDEYVQWRAGRLCPAAIRLHMDARGAEGPEVDVACLVAEPAVDEWELGIRYPTWEQTLTPSSTSASPCQPCSRIHRT